jgi:hypothetical protein
MNKSSLICQSINLSKKSRAGGHRYITGNNCRNHLPQTNLHIRISSHAQSTNPTIIDTPHNTTSQTTTRCTQAKVHTPQPRITYPPAPLQITYPAASSQIAAASSQIAQPKMEPNNLPPPHSKAKTLLNNQSASQPSEPYTSSPEAPT